MTICRTLLGLAGAVLALALHAAPASAQASRTWVSGVGDDANPCSRTAPCKTFAGAISKTATNGEISVLDPGGFGAVNITKSISIIARGSQGSILGSLVNGIIINGANIVVHLEGLTLEGFVNGLNGVRILQASHVTIQDCVIRGFQSAAPNGYGIFYQATTADSRLDVINTVIEANRGGIRINAAGPPFNSAVFDNVTMNRNTSGFGIEVVGNGASVSLMESTIQGSFSATNNGKIFSFGNNALFSGNPTQTVPLE
jgi:hypothetical protein